MSNSSLYSARLRVLALLLVIPFSHAMPSQPGTGEKTLDRTVDPVFITGDKLPGMLGVDIGNMRVFAFHQGKATAIPFQVDQRDASGDWVWDVVYREQSGFIDDDYRIPARRYPASHGRGTVDDQDPAGSAVLDENDVLLLMAQDLGDRSATPHDIDADMIFELRVSDTVIGASGWAYIAYFKETPPPLSKTRYMHYSREQKTIQSPIYNFTVSDDHPALITNLRINNYPIVDKIKVTGEVTLDLPLPTSLITFSEADIHGYTESYIEGPLRIVKRNIAYLSIFGGLVTTRELTCDHYYYARHAEIPVCLSIRFPVKKIAMTLTTDYREPPFHHLYMGEAKDPMIPQDAAATSRTNLHQLGNEWIALDSHEASIVSLMAPPPDLEGHTHTKPCLCRGRLKPGQVKNSPGEQTEAGFIITTTEECLRGEHVIYGSYLLSAEPYRPGDEDAALDLQHNKLTTYISMVPPRRD